MNKKEEFEKLKELIKENIDDARHGIFSNRNFVGDYMINLFDGKYYQLDICYGYGYFEVFGTTKKEFKELEKYYENL